ncbi:hypothetical protein IC614_08985 [Allosphingosinicella flava]|uniref:HhH-GPD domain-containing protein n=1 Tax=Allosphingosinicella flava TaxID=2771430 RepID=A0A7T2GIG7_9SPHN|nr:hypothetical protein [Sphingosinicella flava]QPQ54470.1 hypothetical protein IC614_08985 [Sphingosinicella flava]
MQESFGFARLEIDAWRFALTGHFGPIPDVPRRPPHAQMVKSLISSRTKDAVSLAAYRRLGRKWPSALQLAGAAPPHVEKVIHDVTFADRKAVNLPAALRMIARESGDLRLDFLGNWPVPDALAWLERLPGVGRKVAAATLNASTLRRPVFIVDSHVHRVLQRLGYIGRAATPRPASEKVTASGLDAEELNSFFIHLKHLGQTVCRFESPDCAACPLSTSCPKIISPNASLQRKRESQHTLHPDA